MNTETIHTDNNKIIPTGVYEILEERGFIQQCTDTERVRELLNTDSITVYVGADPTGPSLHIGHMVPFFALAHLQKAGHKPIALMGGGTGLIGDPSGKTEMRKMLTREQIAENVKAISKQVGKVFDVEDPNARVLNNADWLEGLGYISFLREIGVHFSVNRMLSFEAYKQRLERGLSFIEFNYQLLQSYDFMVLNRDHDCVLQIGGDDQWGNIVAGVELIRRTGGGRDAYGLTFPLITRADGKKMGKSEKGAIFLDPELCSPYDFFQYWRNVPDADVIKFLKIFTFLPIEEIKSYEHLEGQALNPIKELLAYEQTKIIHGQQAADEALAAAKAAFASNAAAGNIEGVPCAEYEGTIPAEVVDLFVLAELCKSRSEARRLIKGRGARINDELIEDIEATYNPQPGEEIMLRAGKKRYYRIKFS